MTDDFEGVMIHIQEKLYWIKDPSFETESEFKKLTLNIP